MSDYQAISVLESQVFLMHRNARSDMIRPDYEPFRFEFFQECLADNHKKIFVFEEDGRLAGHCITRRWEYKDHPLLSDITVLEIDDLCVDENARGKGIGKQLFERAKVYAKEIGAAHLELTVWAFNRNAREFYEHLGMSARLTRMEWIIE